MWKGKGRSGFGESSTLGDYDDWSCLSRNGKQWKNPITMETRDLSGADYWHMRKQLTDSYNVPEELHAVNETVSLAHTLPNGKANLLAYADHIPIKKATKVPLKNRILPQSARVDKLRSEAIELEAAFKAGEFSAEEYTLLREVAFKKLRRAEELLKKAVTPVQKQEESYEDEAISYTETFPNPSDNNGHGESYSSPVGGRFFAEVIDELSDRNSFKKILQKACVVARTLVRWNNRTKAYVQTLKEV
ncbi:hypothetical protein [Robertmurraya sp.]|uniref:hypothetical protein n=1 Tax=Robertmurraya sp. TaxID=2837525 RepID=UPI003703D333